MLHDRTYIFPAFELNETAQEIIKQAEGHGEHKKLFISFNTPRPLNEELQDGIYREEFILNSYRMADGKFLFESPDIVQNFHQIWHVMGEFSFDYEDSSNTDMQVSFFANAEDPSAIEFSEETLFTLCLVDADGNKVDDTSWLPGDYNSKENDILLVDNRKPMFSPIEDPGSIEDPQFDSEILENAFDLKEFDSDEYLDTISIMFVLSDMYYYLEEPGLTELQNADEIVISEIVEDLRVRLHPHIQNLPLHKRTWAFLPDSIQSLCERFINKKFENPIDSYTDFLASCGFIYGKITAAAIFYNLYQKYLDPSWEFSIPNQ